MDTKTLDEKLRERARRNLEKEINELMKPVFGQLQIGWHLEALSSKGTPVHVSVKVGEPVPLNQAALNCVDALNMVRAAIIKYRTQRAEDDEVSQFVQKVDGLRDDVDNLYAELQR